MEKTVYKCATCGRDTDYAIYASTQCESCRKDFCSIAHRPNCFIDHVKKDNCKGGHQSILSPEWKMTLHPPK